MTERKANHKPERDPDSVNINIGGNVGPGAVIGPNSSVQATNIAGRDIITRGEMAGKTREDFAKMLGDLRELIEQAQQKGELDAETAKKALQNVEAATDLATQKSPPKKTLLRRLEDVADLLDGAAQTIEAAGGVARVILKAIPVTTLLLKLAGYLF